LLHRRPLAYRKAVRAGPTRLAFSAATGVGAAVRRFLRANWPLAIIVLVGLALRIVWALRVEPKPFGDTYWYSNVAQNLVRGKGFAAVPHSPWYQPAVANATAYYPPLYPLVLAALWKIAGVSLSSGKLLNVCFDAITILIVYDRARRIFGRRVGLGAAATYALLPNAIAWLPLLLSETLFTLFFSAAVWLLIASRPWREARRYHVPIAFGVLTGLAVLTRGVGVILPASALVFWLARDGGRAALQQLLLALVTVALVLAPWTVRNWRVMHTPVFVSSNTGLNLRMGHSDEATGTVVLLSDPIDGVEAWRSIERPEWETRGYHVYTRRALGYAFTHPGRELNLAAKKVYYLYRSDAEMAPALTAWGAPAIEPRALARVLEPLVTATWFLLVFATAASAFFWLRRGPDRLLIVSLFLFWTAFHVTFFGIARFHISLLPLMAVVAAGGTAEALGSLRVRCAPLSKGPIRSFASWQSLWPRH